MKELLVTLLSCVPSLNTYYKHLINNSKDETLKQLRLAYFSYLRLIFFFLHFAQRFKDAVRMTFSIH